jgi:hypothetical protein
LDLLGYQSGHGDDARVIRWIHSGPVSHAWREALPKPVLNLEPPYEDHIAYQSKKPHSAYNVRRAAYWSLLSAPLAGLTYGAHGIWSWETTAKVPLNHANSGTAKPWFEVIQLPGSFHMKVLVEFFGTIAGWKLIPSNELLANQPGSKDPADFISLAASNSRDLLVAYLPMGGEISLNHAVSSFKVTWVDPRTGRIISSRASNSVAYRAPDSQDWLLLLRK